MSDRADADELARRYLDLWQDQMSALAADQDFARAVQQVMTGMGLTGGAAPAAWAGWMAGMQPAMQGDASADARGRKAAQTGRADEPAAAPGAAAPGAASGGGGAELDKLARRLAALEKRIAALEGGAKPSRRPARKPRKPRS